MSLAIPSVTPRPAEPSSSATDTPCPTDSLVPQTRAKLAENKRLNIAILGYRSHPFVGGQGIYIKYLSRALANMGHTVTVFSGQPYPLLDNNIRLVKVPSLDLYEEENHVTALRLHHFKSFADVYEWFTMLTGGFGEPYTFGRRVRKHIQAGDFDIVHDNQSLGRGLLSIQKHTPVVATVHHPIHRDRKLAIDAAPNWKHRLLRKRWYSFLTMQEKVCAKLDHLVTVSKVSQTDIAHFFKRPESSVPVVPNGVDTQTFKPNPSINKLPLRLISTASSDQPLKGLQYLLEALAIAKNQHPKIKLTIIGKLQKNGASDRLLKRLDLQNNIEFKSGLTTRELVHEYQSAQIAVCPSLYEGFGLPAAEAMACGLAVVSSNGGALPEVVGEAGVIVEKANSEALAAAILELLANPERINALGALAIRRIEARFSWDTVARQMTEHYHGIIHHRQQQTLRRDRFFYSAAARQSKGAAPTATMTTSNYKAAPNADD